MWWRMPSHQCWRGRGATLFFVSGSNMLTCGLEYNPKRLKRKSHPSSPFPERENNIRVVCSHSSTSHFRVLCIKEKHSHSFPKASALWPSAVSWMIAAKMSPDRCKWNFHGMVCTHDMDIIHRQTVMKLSHTSVSRLTLLMLLPQKPKELSVYFCSFQHGLLHPPDGKFMHVYLEVSPTAFRRTC